MVEPQFSKLMARVRFPSSPPLIALPVGWTMWRALPQLELRRNLTQRGMGHHTSRDGQGHWQLAKSITGPWHIGA
jgi:hypothetical protein